MDSFQRFVACLLAVALFALGSACAKPLRVAFDEGVDLSAHRTWSWAVESGSVVEAPAGSEAALEAGIRESVAALLGAKGFQHVRSDGDFVVGYRVALARRDVIEQVPRAAYHLTSHSNSPSFVVEGTVPVRRSYQALHLAIVATDERGGPAWRAELRTSGEDTFALSLRAAVDTLLVRFPDRAPRPRSISERGTSFASSY